MTPCRVLLDSTSSPKVLSALDARRLREVALWSRGWPMTRIAAEVGVSTRQVQRDLASRSRSIPAPAKVVTGNGHRFPAKMPSSEARALRRAQAVHLVVGEGWSVIEAARRMGWPSTTIRNDLIEAGVQGMGMVSTRDGRQMPARRLTREQLEDRRARARALRAQGWTFAKIAAELGVSYTAAERDASDVGHGLATDF